MPRHQQHVAAATGGHRSCEPATPPARRRPARSRDEPAEDGRAHARLQHDTGAEHPGRSSSSSAKSATHSTRRPYHLDWGCSCRYVALVLVALAAAAALPTAQGFLAQYATWCGDGVCESRLEKADWCAVDCLCGDGVCDDSEAVSASCPADCLSHVDFAQQPSLLSSAALAFYRQPVVKIANAAQLEAYTPGSTCQIPTNAVVAKRVCVAEHPRLKCPTRAGRGQARFPARGRRGRGHFRNTVYCR